MRIVVNGLADSNLNRLRLNEADLHLSEQET